MNSPAIFAVQMWRGRPRPRTAYSKIAQAGNLCRGFLIALCTLLAASAPGAAAQRSASAHAVAPRPAIPHFTQSAHLPRFRSSPYTSLPFPFFTDFFNPDDIYSTGYPVASEPPVILLQAARAMANAREYPGRPHDENAPPKPQPLVVELQNGRYVRVNSTPANGEVLTAKPASNEAQDAKAMTHSSPAPAITASPTHDLPPAVLVFRDGHSEEVRDYTIADGILYARGDYYIDGYWNKKIELSTLSVAETVQANTTRNVKFILPASPNEVITRP